MTIAEALGACSAADVQAVVALGTRVINILSAERGQRSLDVLLRCLVTYDAEAGSQTNARAVRNRRLAAPAHGRASPSRIRLNGELQRSDDHYFLSSLPLCRLISAHWLLVIRRHWGDETAHQARDVSFEEDDRPFIEANPRGALVVAILRRIAYTILTLSRSVTQRSDERRHAPWKDHARPLLG